MLPLSDARGLATAIRDNLLAPFCSRIEIAGSVRRQSPMVKDLEIVAISTIGHRIEETESLFGKQEESISFPLLDAYLQSEVRNDHAHLLWWQLKENGVRVGDGPRYKKLCVNPDVLPRDPQTGEKLAVNVDLFIAQEDNWGNQFAIRTGHRFFSEGLMWAAQRRGLKQAEGFLWRGEDRVPCLEESDFFMLLGLPLLPPSDRTLQVIQRLVPGFVPREIREKEGIAA